MLNFPTFPSTFCVFTCWGPPSQQTGACVTTIFAANGGTFLAVRPGALICYPWIQGPLNFTDPTGLQKGRGQCYRWCFYVFFVCELTCAALAPEAAPACEFVCVPIYINCTDQCDRRYPRKK